MKDFEEYLYKMGYSWNDFDRTYEMANLIEQYTDEKVNQALSIANVVGQSEQLPCGHKHVELVRHAAKCKDCGTVFETKW